MAAPYKPRKPGSLKEACALLVERAGGQKTVATLLRCSAQNVARMTDDDHKQLLRADQVLLLEATVKDPIVTRFIAGVQNCIVEPVQCDHAEPLPFVMGRITKETGEMLSAAAQAVSTGKLTATNAAMVLRETDDVVCALAQLRAACRETLDGEAP
jgi:hypothetical protein